MQNFIRRRSRRVVAAAMLAALPSVSSAATFIWSGGDATVGYFAAGDNWAGNSAPPTSGADLIFAGTNAHNSAPFAETAYSVNSINFSTGAYAFSGNQQIEANLLTIAGGGIIDLASNLETISNPAMLSANQTWNVSGGNFNTTGSVILGTSALTAYVPSGAMSFNGALVAGASSTATFTKTGAGLLTINAGSTSDSVGLLNLTQGTINLSGGTVLTTLASGSSYLGAVSSSTATMNITGAGSYLNASSCSFFFGNGSGQSGTMNVSNSGEFIAGVIFVPGGGAGTLNVTSGGNVQTGALYLGDSGTSGSSATVLVSGSGSVMDVTQLTVGQANNGSLTISSSASVAVSNVTTFGNATFPINISGGTFSTGALSSNTTVSGQIMMSAATTATGITIQGGSGIAGEYFGTLTGTGIVYKSGASIQAFGSNETVNGLTVNGGQLNISGGTFKVTNVNTPLIVNGSGLLTVNSGATLDASATTNIGYIDGSGTGATMTVTGSGSTYKAGSYLAIGYNTGDTGTLNVTSSGNVSAGTLYVPLSGKGIVNLSSNGSLNTNQLDFGGTGQTSLITVNSGGSFNVSGLSYFLDSAARLNMSGGSFVTGALSSSGVSSSGSINLIADPAGGSALTINGNSGNNTYSGSITGPIPTGTAGSLLKTGASTQILSGFLNYNGGLTVNGGTLAVTGTAVGNSVGYLSVQSGALNISSGLMSVFGPQLLNVSGGTLNVNSGAALTVNSAQSVQIDGATNSPTINVSGSGTVFNASSLSVNVAVTAGNSGVLNVNSGAVFDANVLAVPGAGGNGVLNVSSGGIVNCGALYLDFGSQAGSCVAILSGVGSQINATSLTLSSSNNPGSLTIANGAILKIPTVLTFTTSAFPINVSGGSLSAAGLNSQGTGTSGAVNLLADAAIGAALTLNGSSGTYGYSGSFSGPGSLLKSGGSTQIYTGTGSLGSLQVNAGAFNVNGGSLTLTGNNGALRVDGGSLLVNGGATINATSTSGINYVDNGALTVTGAGTKFLTANEFDVGESDNPSTLIVSNSAQMSTASLNVPYYGFATALITTSAQVSTGTLFFGDGNVSNLTVSAGGALIVTGSSVYSDTTSAMNISGGTFTTGGLVSNSSNGKISLTDPSSGVALTVNPATGTNSFSGKLSGTGSLNKTGGSTQILAGGNSSIGVLSVQAGALNVSGGTLALTRASGNPVSVTGGTLTIDSAASVTAANSQTFIGGAGAANLTVSGSGSKLNAPVQISLGGTGLATLTATQQAAVTSGNIYMGSQSALVINSGGTVSSGYDGVAYTSGSTTSVTVDGQGSSWTDSVMYVGGYVAAGGNGTVTISNLAAVTTKINTGFESNTATINVSGGTLTTGSLSSLSNGNGTILLTDPALGSALTLNDNTATDINTYSGSISGTGSLTKTGASTQILSGNNTFTGAVSVSGGMLSVGNSGNGRALAASNYQINNAVLNITAGYLGSTSPVYVESGGVLTGPANFLNIPITLFPGGTFLPGTYNGSSPGISGTSALIQSIGSLSSFASLSLLAPTTIAVNGTDSLTLQDLVTTNGNPITKTGTGLVNIFLTKTSKLTINAGTLLANSLGDLQATTLTIAPGAQLDLNITAGDFGTSLAIINGYVQQGYNNGRWNGSGIISSAAASDAKHLTAVGVIQNNQSGTAIYTASHPFEGITPGAGDVLAKYTYYGDANLDGKVDGSDYSRIDAAYLADQTNPAAATGWFNGDFNYDGVVNGSDYTLIDNAFNTQGALLLAELANPTAQLDSGATSAVPEPSSFIAILFGGVGLLGRRQKRSPAKLW